MSPAPGAHDRRAAPLLGAGASVRGHVDDLSGGDMVTQARDRRVRRRWVVATVVGVLGALVSGGMLAVPSAAAGRAQAEGVTRDEILVVGLVADLDGLRAAGFNLPPKLTTGNLTRRWQAYFDEFGPINGRTIRLETVVWDPLDSTSFDRACVQATQDRRPFVILNSAGYRQSSVGCLTIDNETPLFIGDPMYRDMMRASGNRLFTLPPPGDVTARALGDIVARKELVPRGEKVGILSSNELGVKASADALERRLERRGFDVAVKVEINQLSGDAALMSREATASVETFRANDVTTVFVGIPFTASLGYFQELNRTGAGLETFIIDSSAQMCTIFAAPRIPIEAAGTPCLTSADTRALPTKDGIKPDSPAEAKCRATFDRAFQTRSQPGVPSGDVTAGGVVFTEDFPFDYCNITNLLLPAMEEAGRRLTWDRVAANLEATTSAPAIYMSGGEGGFGPNKRYFAKNVHLVTLNPANAQTPRDANGLFNGCPAPVSCWIPQLVDGQQWFPISRR